MNKAVADTHCLLGSQLRDPDSGRQGRIVGIDQARETPALLVNWGQAGVERVTLSVTELSDLVAASLAHERNTRRETASDARQSSGSASGAAPQPSGDKSADRGSAPASQPAEYPPRATGSDGRR